VTNRRDLNHVEHEEERGNTQIHEHEPAMPFSLSPADRDQRRQEQNDVQPVESRERRRNEIEQRLSSGLLA
jgi:hypothetical protein